MSVYQVYLEIDDQGWCMAHVPELLGCFTLEKTQKRTLSKLSDKIREHISWLKKNGEKIATPKKIEIQVSEIQMGTCPRISGNQAAIFSFDLIPPSVKKIKQVLRWMGYNRKELLAKTRKLSDEVLDWKPDKKTRSIRETLSHVANCDWWYLSRFGDWKELYAVPQKYPPEKIFEKLDTNRKLAMQILKNLLPEDGYKINIPQKYTKHKDEVWTCGKMLRRFLEHEREHIETIDKALLRYKEAHL
jgi:predicted RNase H-like HicB family nuclease